MKPIFLVFILSFVSFSFVAQSPSENYLGAWYTFGSNHKLNEKFSISSYAELRFYEPSSNYNLAFLSLRCNYHFKNKSIGFGYAYLDIDRVFEFDRQPNVHENRLFEQFTLKHKISKISILHRIRFEHRFLNVAHQNEILNRYRYLFSVSYKLNNNFFVSISEEPFVNFQNQVFHENRFYAGFGYHIFKNTTIKIGYLRQHISKRILNRIRSGLSFAFDHSKKKYNKASL